MVGRSRSEGIVHRETGSRNQPIVFLLLAIVCFGSMVGRLFWLQVLQGSVYRQLSEENRIRLISREPIRGQLLDRKGRILAGNRLSYNLSIQPRLVNKNEWPIISSRLTKLLGISKDFIDTEFNKGTNQDPFRIILVRDLTPEQVLKFRERENSFKKINGQLQNIAEYSTIKRNIARLYNNILGNKK